MNKIRFYIAEFRNRKWIELEEVISLLDKLNYSDNFSKEDIEELITKLEGEL